MRVFNSTESEIPEVVNIQVVLGIEMEVVNTELKKHMGTNNMAYK